MAASWLEPRQATGLPCSPDAGFVRMDGPKRRLLPDSIDLSKQKGLTAKADILYYRDREVQGQMCPGATKAEISASGGT